MTTFLIGVCATQCYKKYVDSKLQHKGLFIIYGQGDGFFLRGNFFCKSLMGEAHICDKLPVRATFLAQYFVNPMKTHFLWVSGKNKTKKCRQKILRGPIKN